MKVLVQHRVGLLKNTLPGIVFEFNDFYIKITMKGKLQEYIVITSTDMTIAILLYYVNVFVN